MAIGKSVTKLMRRRRAAGTARHGEAGYSLIEIMIVVVIIALLVGLVAPRVIGYLGRAKTDTAEIQIEQIAAAMNLFYLDMGRYPNEEEGLEALVENRGDAPNWQGPYLEKNRVPLDPWGRPYRYETPGRDGPFELYTLGADDAAGGEDENQDVYY